MSAPKPDASSTANPGKREMGLGLQRSRMRRAHSYYQRSGFYGVLGSNLLKMLIVLAVFVAIFLLAEPYVMVYQQELETLIQEQLAPATVFLLFFVSESILGLIPPDLFMLWAKARFPSTPFLMVGALAVTSYVGGIMAYTMGRAMKHMPSVHTFLSERHAEHVQFIRQWGGVFILIAALLPIPYAIASTVAGLVKFPIRAYLLFGLARILRFYLYALVLFNIL